MTTYVLAGSVQIARYECNQKDIWFNFTRSENVLCLPNRMNLEGRNIVKGDKVLFCYATTVEMIDRFMAQCWSRGTQLSDLEIIHGPN